MAGEECRAFVPATMAAASHPDVSVVLSVMAADADSKCCLEGLTRVIQDSSGNPTCVKDPAIAAPDAIEVEFMSAKLRSFQIVVAATKQWGIGKDGRLPWTLPSDMAIFKKITSEVVDEGKSNAVIMGKRTWHSIPVKFQPLPGRVNVVLSTKGMQASEKIVVCDSLTSALALLGRPPYESMVESVFVIGGANVFREAMNSSLCDAIHLTEIDAHFDCDTFMPPVNSDSFRLWNATFPVTENNIRYSFKTYVQDANQIKLPKFILERHEEYQYLKLIEEIIETGNVKSDRTGTGTLSKFGCQMRFNLRNSFPLLTTKRVFWRGVVEELLWFISGSTNGKVLEKKGINIWSGNGSREYLDSIGLSDREEGDLGPVYGFQWRHFGARYTNMNADYSGQGVDQLADVINKIKSNPDDRRIILSAWNPADLKLMALPPCHMFAQFFVSNGELSCQMYQRSCDMGLGVPFNVASYALLTCMIAHVCDLAAGDFIHVLGDAHVYVNHVQPLRQQLKNTPKPFPILKIVTEKKDIDAYTADDLELKFYEPHSKIPMKMAEGVLQRHVMALIVSHLRDNNLIQAATAVANGTMTPLNTEIPQNKLLELVQKGLAAERDEALRSGGGSSANRKSAAGAISAGYGPRPAFPTKSVDFGAASSKRSAKKFPKHDSRHVAEHKNAVRCARFSPDGRLVATGSADTSVKLFDVDKVRQMMAPDGGSVKPVLRTFYDHMQPVNDLDFHPQSAILISGSKDRTIKFFDFAKSAARKAFRVIQDTHSVRSVSFHPCGDYLLAGTDHAIPHLYDVNTFQCYLSSSLQDSHVGDAVNQVRYSGTGSMYVSASKDGGVRIWDGKNARCIRAITSAHGSAEATSATFTKDHKYILSCGKDSAVALWDVGSGKQVKKYVGTKHPQMRCQAVFNSNEEFVLCMDESSGSIVAWDALTAEIASRFASNHSSGLRWLEHSPTESFFVTCGSDRSVRFWKES